MTGNDQNVPTLLRCRHIKVGVSAQKRPHHFMYFFSAFVPMCCGHTSNEWLTESTWDERRRKKT